MSRIKVAFPTVYSFKTQLPVLVQHINWGNHLGNDSYLAFAHEARVRYLDKMGFKENLIDGSTGIVLTDSYIKYQKEAFYGDLLNIFVCMKNLTKLQVDFFYEFKDANTQEVIALVKTGCAFFDYSKRTLAPLNQSVLSKLKLEITS